MAFASRPRANDDADRPDFWPSPGALELISGSSAIIRGGPYRFVRHPMYSAVLLFIWAGVISHVSTLTLPIGIAITAVVVARVVAEERLLRARYPDYADYARSTKALVPFLF